jgi:hypothetical protein
MRGTMLDKREELTQELRRARMWILAVGIIMVVCDQIFFAMQIPAGMSDHPLVVALRHKLMIADGLVLAFFIGMFFFAKFKPVLACVLALVAFWGLQIWAASGDASNLYKGIILKIGFTIALVKGIQSAARAQTLQSELGQVFE